MGLETLLAVAPHLEREESARQLQFNDFPGFLRSFKFAVMHLNTADDYRLLARQAFAQLKDQGIVYAEVIHSAGICLWRGLDAEAIAAALLEEGRRAPLEVRWIFDAVRQLGERHVLQTARFTAGFRGTEVVGFGVGGDELGCPAAMLKPAFDLAAEQGFWRIPHAGETSNAANVREALELGAERIGHGIRAVEDPALLAELRGRGVPLEISITSNVKTGAVGSYAEHPLPRLHAAGVPLLLNTDDPVFFETTLEKEYEHAAAMGLPAEALEEIRLNAFRFAAGGPPHP